MADLQQLEEAIVGLSLLDAAALVKKLEDRLGVSAAAAAPVMVAGGARLRRLPRRRRRPSSPSSSRTWEPTRST